MERGWYGRPSHRGGSVMQPKRTLNLNRRSGRVHSVRCRESNTSNGIQGFLGEAYKSATSARHTCTQSHSHSHSQFPNHIRISIWIQIFTHARQKMKLTCSSMTLLTLIVLFKSAALVNCVPIGVTALSTQSPEGCGGAAEPSCSSPPTAVEDIGPEA